MDPKGPQQMDFLPPPAPPCDNLGPLEEPPPLIQPNNSTTHLVSALQEGPFQSHIPMTPADWFATVAALAPAIANGIKTIDSPELVNQLSQTPWFALALAEIRSGLATAYLTIIAPDNEHVHCEKERWWASVITDAHCKMTP
jgi:hypothetical protein